MHGLRAGVMYASRHCVLSEVKMDHMSPSEVKMYLQIADDPNYLEKYSQLIELFSKSKVRPEEILRRFSLNGDGKLDYREFMLSMKRLGVVWNSPITQDIYRTFCPRSGQKVDINMFCRILAYWCGKTMKLVPEEGKDKSDMPLSDSLQNKSTLSTDIHRALSLIKAERDKFYKCFLQMDVDCSGYLSLQELILGLSHHGVNLSPKDYDSLVNTLPSSVIVSTPEESNPSINYANFLAFIDKDHPQSTSMALLKLWDTMVLEIEHLSDLIMAADKGKTGLLAPGIFRECLARCGIMVSPTDFAALRVKLLEFSDDQGNIRIPELIQELRRSPVFPKSERRKSIDSHLAPSAAGKTSEQRCAEADRSISRHPENHSKKSEFGEQYLHHPGSGPQNSKACLEERIWDKLNHQRAVGHYTSLPSFFPSDRFGNMTRGRFRQCLAHLGVVSRYAEVERIFWELDPKDNGVAVRDIYSHLEDFRHTAEEGAENGKSKPNLTIETGTQAKRAHQRVLDSLMEKIPEILAACKMLDDQNTGSISKDYFIWALQEAGVLMSWCDANSVVEKLSGRRDGVIKYRELDTLLEEKCSVILSPRKKSLVRSHAGAIIQHEPDDNQQTLTEPTRTSLVLSPREQEERRHGKKTRDFPTNAFHQKVDPIVKQTDLPLLQRLQHKLAHFKETFEYLKRDYPENVSRLELANILCSSKLGLNTSPAEGLQLIDQVIPKDTLELDLSTLEAAVVKLGTEVSVLEPAPTKQTTSTATEKQLHQLVNALPCLRNINTVSGNKTTGVLIRHAFRGFGKGFTGSYQNSGKFDAFCRCQDLRLVCRRFGLDLTTQQAQYIATQVDKTNSGFIASAELVEYFKKLASEGEQVV